PTRRSRLRARWRRRRSNCAENQGGVGKGALAPCPPTNPPPSFLRCSPFFTASLEAWATSARGDPQDARNSALLRLTAVYVLRSGLVARFALPTLRVVRAAALLHRREAALE